MAVWRAGLQPSSLSLVEKRAVREEHTGTSLFFYGTLVHPKILARG